ncbi:MAG TPA: hypothetical protein VMF65_18345 [Acidimicrobiales bacterium]|nr:hypothetical protein [Acidimicrobiales bacterium]
MIDVGRRPGVGGAPGTGPIANENAASAVANETAPSGSTCFNVNSQASGVGAGAIGDAAATGRTGEAMATDPREQLASATAMAVPTARRKSHGADIADLPIGLACALRKRPLVGDDLHASGLLENVVLHNRAVKRSLWERRG